MAAVSRDTGSSPYVDVVVLTALAEEKAAFLAAVGQTECQVARRAGGDAHVSSLEELRIAVVSLQGMGNVGAAAAAAELIEVWRPRFMVLVGIAAGIRGYARDLQFGDVLVADQVVGFELAKVTADGTQRRYQSFRPLFELLSAAHGVTSDEWTGAMSTPRPDGTGTPRAHVGTVLSGEKVFADITSVRELRRAWPTAIGVEMEGLGAAWAAYRGGSGFLLVKGVSDFADIRKDDRWRAYAAEAAARFTLAALRRLATSLPRPWPRQLPRDAIGFTGRGVELERLLAAASDTRPATVVISAIDGMAGIGKTALAVHAAHRLAEHFPDGQLFVDLHGFTAGVARVEPPEALDRLLRDVGVPGERIPAGLENRAALWRSVLAGRRMLIVLDNAATEEHVQPLLPGAAGSLVLVTSRRRLTALEATTVLSLDTLPEADATELFVHTADRPDLAPDAPEVAEVVRLCGRLPLAIRIAAARLKHRPAWTIADLIRRLSDLDARLAVLDDGRRSVHTTLGLSYQHLSPHAQRLYRTLGLHPGPDIEPYAAAALTGDNLAEVGRGLDELVDNHLLHETTAGRFRFHDLVRAHAVDTAAHHESRRQQRAALDRLLDHYRHTAVSAIDAAYPYEQQLLPAIVPAGTPTPDLADSKQAEQWLETELANILAAVHHAVADNRPDHVWQLSIVLDRHIRIHGRCHEAQTLHQDALGLARRLDNPPAEMNALNSLGHVLRRLGRHEKAADHYSRALHIAQDIADHRGELQALNGLGHIHRRRGRHEQSRDHFVRALKIACRIGDHSGELNALAGLGDVHRMLERHALAAGYYERALRIARAIGDRSREQIALYGLGDIHKVLGRTEVARDHFNRGLEIAHAIGDRIGEVNALGGLGRLNLMLGRYEDAGDQFGRALQIAQATGDRLAEVNALNGLATVHRAMGRRSESAGHYQRVLVLARDLGSSNWQYEALQGLGRLHHTFGRPDLSLTHHQHALRLATELAQPADQARAHDGLAHAHRALGEHNEARKHWQNALDILTSLAIDQTEDMEASGQSIRAHLSNLDRQQAPAVAAE